MVDGNLGQISGAIFSSISGQVLTTESTSGATRHNWSNSGGWHWPNIMSLEPFEMIDWHLKTLLHAAMLPMAVALRIAALTKYCIAFALSRATPARNRTSCDAIYGSAFPDAAALIALVICDRVESR
jgi:hypothetical protein